MFVDALVILLSHMYRIMKPSATLQIAAAAALAPRSCLLCRTRRRKCTRELPSCSECKDLKKKCEYQSKALKIQSESHTLQTKRIRSALTKISARRPVFVIGSEDVFTRPQSLGISVPVTQNVLRFLRTAHEISLVQDEYFETIHVWMPIINKSLHRKARNGTTKEPRADLALLLLCMKLLTTLPDPSNFNGMRTELYSTVKGLYRAIEVAGRYSTQFLQAGLLIGVYEIGHALCPESYVTIAKNTRLGIKLGIHVLYQDVMDPRPCSWAEEEERNRTWWGIMIMDRFASLRNRGRGLSTPTPAAEQAIPTDDIAWEADTPIPRETLSSPSHIPSKVCIFAREAHASYLLGTVLNLKLNEVENLRTPTFDDQLDITLEAFFSVLQSDISTGDTSYDCAIGMCNSASLALHTPSFLGPECWRNSLELLEPDQRLRRLAAWKRAADRVLGLEKAFFHTVKFASSDDVHKVTPLMPDSLFQAAIVYRFLWRQTGQMVYFEAFTTMRKSLEYYGRRWGAAADYLNWLDLESAKTRSYPADGIDLLVHKAVELNDIQMTLKMR